ncbi:MAG: hypothetical protein E1N59_242 [Puniceicoccaceae bacterium 5H]|nr:MAG: hypothetical protein E1N59_242 [Puniceicoccaceae bacterium 5H]
MIRPNTRFCLTALVLTGFLAGCQRATSPAARDADASSPSADQMERSWPEREFTVELKTPTPAHAVAIQEVWQVGGEVWVWAQVARGEGMAAQVISTSTDRVSLDAPPGEVEYYISGIDWNWAELPDHYHRITSPESFDPAAEGGTQLYPAKP